MILFSSLGFLLILALLLGLLLGWLLSWLFDGFFRRRRAVRIAEFADHAHDHTHCPEGHKKKELTAPSNCEANYFVLEPDWVETTDHPSHINLPAVRPCFTLRWGDSKDDHLETDGVETLCITATNPYSNVLFRNVTIALLAVTRPDGSPAPTLPDDTPAIGVTPTELIRLGDLAPTNPTDPHAAAGVICEVTLNCQGAESGPYLFKLWSDYSVVFTVQQIAPYRLPIAPACENEGE